MPAVHRSDVVNRTKCVWPRFRDLFSYLDDAAEDDEINNEEPTKQDRPPVTSKRLQKRKADTPPPAVDGQTANGYDTDVNINGAGPSVHKMSIMMCNEKLELEFLFLKMVCAYHPFFLIKKMLANG